MSAITDESDGSFRLSQLIYDTRYRSLTIQAVASILLVLFFSWLIWNTIQNLEALGKDFNFGFLGNRAGYDINQRLIEYSSDSSHGRAALVGILNTLLVAVLGCVLATVLGVIAGVLRLSNNWIVARLMTIYVEGFRNIPLLLWILLIAAIFSESLPLVRTFREEGAMSFFGTVAFSNQGTFLPRPTFSSWAFLIVLAILVWGIATYFLKRWQNARQQQTGELKPILLPSLGILVVALGLSTVLANMLSRGQEMTLLVNSPQANLSVTQFAEAGRFDYCRRINDAGDVSLQRHLSGVEGVDFRVKEYFGDDDARTALVSGRCGALPVLASDAETVLAGLNVLARDDANFTTLDLRVPVEGAVLFDVPAVTEKGIPKFEGGLVVRNSLIALWLALSLYTGAFIAEIVRAGILAINKGQSEAAFALGLRPGTTMRKVILPQALRVIVPPLISQYLNLTKNSSLALAVGYMDVRSTLGGITINQTGRELEGMLLLGGFYLVTSLVISGAMNIYNASIKLKER